MKKAQAAVEFLATYGWAILATIIAIGALSYFGIINFSAPPTQCSIGMGLDCVDYKISSDMVRFYLINNLGDDANISNIRMVSEDEVFCPVQPSSLLFASRAKEQFNATDCISGPDFKATVEIIYQLVDDNEAHKIIGFIKGKVER
ncbi:hypothetical protein JW756_04585 [Candidatus Woesearchaeota archaeon]|nr:hypothetical protein [Candidatus Woesearchaeota archaeon]